MTNETNLLYVCEECDEKFDDITRTCHENPAGIHCLGEIIPNPAYHPEPRTVGQYLARELDRIQSVMPEPEPVGTPEPCMKRRVRVALDDMQLVTDGGNWWLDELAAVRQSAIEQVPWWDAPPEGTFWIACNVWYESPASGKNGMEYPGGWCLEPVSYENDRGEVIKSVAAHCPSAAPADPAPDDDPATIPTRAECERLSTWAMWQRITRCIAPMDSLPGGYTFDSKYMIALRRETGMRGETRAAIVLYLTSLPESEARRLMLAALDATG